MTSIRAAASFGIWMVRYCGPARVQVLEEHLAGDSPAQHVDSIPEGRWTTLYAAGEGVVDGRVRERSERGLHERALLEQLADGLVLRRRLAASTPVIRTKPERSANA